MNLCSNAQTALAESLFVPCGVRFNARMHKRGYTTWLLYVAESKHSENRLHFIFACVNTLIQNVYFFANFPLHGSQWLLFFKVKQKVGAVYSGFFWRYSYNAQINHNLIWDIYSASDIWCNHTVAEHFSCGFESPLRFSWSHTFTDVKPTAYTAVGS